MTTTDVCPTCGVSVAAAMDAAHEPRGWSVMDVLAVQNELGGSTDVTAIQARLVALDATASPGGIALHLKHNHS